VLVALLGVAVRYYDSASYRRAGFDEQIYRRYVYLMDGGKQQFAYFRRNQAMSLFETNIEGRGLSAMPSVMATYLQTQNQPNADCELPPTRVLYLYTSWLWRHLRWGDTPPLPAEEVAREKAIKDENVPYEQDASRRDPALAALNEVTCGFSMLAVIAGGLFAFRMLGRAAGLGVLSLMAFDPLSIHLSQHAMIDGFFAFWALMCLWTTWECLRHPASKGWLAAHALCLAGMVLTKENALFVYCALGAMVVSNRWLRFGTVTPRFLICSVVAPALAVGALVALAGGPTTLAAAYRVFISKAQTLEYVQLNGDGPWYRYLLDLLIMSPIVLCLALGALFTLVGKRKELAVLAIFVAVSYLIMCNLRYGMNLRFASIWAFPLRVAAFLMIWQLCARLGAKQWMAATALVSGLSLYELRQYSVMAIDGRTPFYECATTDMLRQVNIYKTPSDVVKHSPATPPAPAN
jgi:hypothetical protein